MTVFPLALQKPLPTLDDCLPFGPPVSSAQDSVARHRLLVRIGRSSHDTNPFWFLAAVLASQEHLCLGPLGDLQGPFQPWHRLHFQGGISQFLTNTRFHEKRDDSGAWESWWCLSSDVLWTSSGGGQRSGPELRKPGEWPQPSSYQMIWAFLVTCLGLFL